MCDNGCATPRLFAHHRYTFMKERRDYFTRRYYFSLLFLLYYLILTASYLQYFCRKLAIDHPDKYLSIIMDGMSQNHSELPYRCGKCDFPKKLVCHLQGSIVHGHEFTVYRSFNNCPTGSNLAIAVLLMELEKHVNEVRLIL